MTRMQSANADTRRGWARPGGNIICKGFGGGRWSSSKETSDPDRMFSATSNSDFRTIPCPARAQDRMSQPSFTTRLPRTVTRCLFDPVPNSQTLSNVSPKRITRQLWCLRSSGDCGVPCLSKYAGAAHTRRWNVPRLRTLRVESVTLTKRTD